MSKKIQNILVVSLETTGINYTDCDRAVGHQILAGGFIVADSKTFTPIEKRYIEIKWDPMNAWDSDAESYHGLSKKYLNQNGITEEDAVVQIGELILRNIPSGPIVMLGHNVSNFTYWFMSDIFHKYDIDLTFSARMLDTFTIGKTVFGLNDSKDIFNLLGKNPTNALDKAEAYLTLFRLVKKLVSDYG